VPFYFGVCTNGMTERDEEGLELLRARAAKLESSAEMLRDRMQREAESADISIIVRDGSPQPGVHCHCRSEG
jgi:hypothetical protein